MATRGVEMTITYVAWDTSNNVGKTGDVANHTLRWVKDGTSGAPTNSASEVDATNAPGLYKLTLTSTETDANIGTLHGASSTANISIIPIIIQFERLPNAAPGGNGGVPTVDANNYVAGVQGTKNTLDDLNDFDASTTSVDLNADQSGVTIGTCQTNADMRGTDDAFLASSAPTNFSSLAINASGHISRVTLVDTTTTNTDMRGTDNAFLAANAPTNFSDLTITATTGLVSLAADQSGVTIGTVNFVFWTEELGPTAESQVGAAALDSLIAFRLGDLVPQASTVSDASPTADSFTASAGSLSSLDDAYNGMTLTFSGGNLEGIARRISDYDGTSKTFTLENAFPAAPTNGSSFSIIATDVPSIAGITSTLSDIESTVNDLPDVETISGVVNDDITSTHGIGSYVTATGFSTHSAADVRTEMDSNSTQLAAIVEDTGTTIPGTLSTIVSQTGDMYHAFIDLRVDDANSQDEWTVVFMKNDAAVTSGITSPTIQVVKRADGTDLIAETAMTQIGATGMYKYDEGTDRTTAGEAVIAIVSATIDGSERTWRQPLGRDSSE